jgi:hypothetical protein
LKLKKQLKKIRLKKLLFIFFVSALSAGIYNNVNPYPRNLLIEFSTSVTCSACPCMDSLIFNALLNQYEGTNAIAYHTGEFSDPFANFRGKEINGFLNLVGSPCTQIDRIFGYGIYFDSTLSAFQSRYQSAISTPVQINIINKIFNTGTRDFSVTFNSVSSQALTGLFCYQLLIYENNLIYPQAQGECGGGPNFVHQLVAREVSNGRITGDTLINGAWNTNQAVTKTISTFIKSSWAAENCRFIIVVYKLNSPETLALAEVQQSLRGNVTGTIGIKNENEIAADYFLSQNYPNPFNPVTNIKFSIPKYGSVELKVFDINGKEIATLCNQSLQKGSYNVEFNADKLSSGMYFYTLRTNEFTSTNKMILIK